MRRLLGALILIAATATFTFAQTEKKDNDHQQTDEKTINSEWQEAIRTAEEALRDIEIPDIDVDQIMRDVKEAMPSREEIEDYKEIVTDAVSELKEIDLSGLEEALSELRYELGEIFSDSDWEDRDREREGDRDEKKRDRDERRK